MGKSATDMRKRQIAHAWANCERAQLHIASVGQEFGDYHPELVQLLLYATQGLMGVQDLLKDFAVRCWGMSDPDWESWRNVPGQPSIKDENDLSIDGKYWLDKLSKLD